MKKYFIAFIISIFMFLPLMVNGSTASVSLNCPSGGAKGASIDCTLSVNQTGGVSAVKGNFELGKVKYKKFKAKGTYDVSQVSEEGFLLGIIDGFKKSTTLGTLSLALPSDASSGEEFTIKITNITATDLEFNDIEHNDIVKTLRILSNINTLSSLSITNFDISFKETTLSYSITTDSESITINALAKDKNASVSGTGKKTLKYGKNEFKIVVTAEDGSKKTYTIVANRPDHRNSNNYLKSLSVDVGNIDFSKDTTSYTINVNSDVKIVKINAEIENEKSSFVKNYGNRSVELKDGKNEILVKVIAENESIRTYTINIVKESDSLREEGTEKPIEPTELLSNNNRAKNIGVKGYDIDFDPSKTEYEIKTSAEVLDLKIELEESNAKYTISGNENLSNGSIVKITVIAENGQENIYSIKIIDNELSTIKIVFAVLLILANIVLFIAIIITKVKAS